MALVYIRMLPLATASPSFQAPYSTRSGMSKTQVPKLGLKVHVSSVSVASVKIRSLNMVAAKKFLTRSNLPSLVLESIL